MATKWIGAVVQNLLQLYYILIEDTVSVNILLEDSQLFLQDRIVVEETEEEEDKENGDWIQGIMALHYRSFIEKMKC